MKQFIILCSFSLFVAFTPLEAQDKQAGSAQQSEQIVNKEKSQKTSDKNIKEQATEQDVKSGTSKEKNVANQKEGEGECRSKKIGVYILK